jgi:hypothetical protein
MGQGGRLRVQIRHDADGEAEKLCVLLQKQKLLPTK